MELWNDWYYLDGCGAVSPHRMKEVRKLERHGLWIGNGLVRFKCGVKVRGVVMLLLQDLNVWGSGRLEQHSLRGAAPHDLEVQASVSCAKPVVDVNRQWDGSARSGLSG